MNHNQGINIQEAIANCANEKIRKVDFIQAHGFVFILDEQFTIKQISENLINFLELDLRTIVGKKLSEFISNGKINELRSLADDSQILKTRYTELELQGTYFNAVIHKNSKNLILELEEKIESEEFIQSDDVYLTAMNFAQKLENIETEDQLFKLIVKEIKSITGFSRVKLYRFTEEWDGEVIAEAKESHMNSYLENHFPASDIPEQARELYKINHLRIISNVNSSKVSLKPSLSEKNDLSHSILRSVSEIHLEYLRNMNIKASMSISIIVDGELWGLIACHHHEIRCVPYGIRILAELINKQFSQSLKQIISFQNKEKSLQTEIIIKNLNQEFQNNSNLIVKLAEAKDLILDSMNLDSFALVENQNIEIFQTKNSKNADELKELIHKIIQKKPESFVSSSIKDDYSIENQENIAGALSLKLNSANSFLIFFRKELITEIKWAGKPKKLINHEGKLSPRNSFETWVEEQRDQAESWSQEDLKIAKALKTNIVNELKDTETSNLEEDMFSFIVNHNLKEPLRHIQNYMDLFDLKYSKELDDTAKQYLLYSSNAAQKIEKLLQDLLSYSNTSSSGKLSLGSETSVKNCINKSWDELYKEYPEIVKDIKIENNVRDELKLKIHEKHLSSIFTNIFSHISKLASPLEEKRIKIEAKEQGNYVQIKISDNFSELDKIYFEKAFRVFQTIESQGQQKDTGINLALSKKILNIYLADISISENPEAELEFSIKIPANLSA